MGDIVSKNESWGIIGRKCWPWTTTIALVSEGHIGKMVASPIGPR